MNALKTPDFSQFKLDLDSKNGQHTNPGLQTRTAAKFIDKGKHEVTIQDAVWEGEAKVDPTWHKLRLTYADSSGATIREWILVPTTSAKYGPEKKDGVFLKLQRFLSCLGFDITRDTADTLVPQVFRDITKLIGLKVCIQVGYRAHHINYVSKGKYTLSTTEGEPIKDANGVVEFQDRKAAEEYCTMFNLDLSKYPDVQRYFPAMESNNLAKFSSAKKVSKAFSL